MRDSDRIKEKVVIRLDNMQVGVALLGVLAVCAAVFSAGVVVGQQMGDSGSGTLGALTGVYPAEPADFGVERPTKGRMATLAAISPGTRAVAAELALPSPPAIPSDPTDAARVEAHRQIAVARRGGTARSLGPVAVERAGLPPVSGGPVQHIRRVPTAAVPAAPSQQAGFALQVTTFGNEAPARVVAEQLRRAGHDSRVSTLTSGGFRVEVGRYDDANAATSAQGDFERTSGFSTIVVAVR